MFGIGFPELVVILLIVLIIFGAGRLPQLGKSLGKGIKEFQGAVKGNSEQGNQDKKNNESLLSDEK
ncbi:MAG: twin-arginine translocase TatA/TatE family subunit [bacterium]|nr:twin-arginine translocase TatA/TatE family subunit [bacterium]